MEKKVGKMRGLVLAIAVVAGVGALPGRADALTANEKYVTRVYQDFLLRAPSSSELSAGVAQVGTSRATFVSGLFATSGFRQLWILGTHVRYTGAAPSPSVASSQLSALNSSGNYLSIEADDLGGTRYWDNAGGTNEDFLTELYGDVLDRAPDPSGQSYWLGKLVAGTATPRVVASNLLRSTEAASLRTAGPSSAVTCAATTLADIQDLRYGSYCLVLDRMADPSGKTYWTNQLATSGQLPGLWQSLATSNEYFNLTQA